MTSSQIALLVLEDGTVFRGRPWGALGSAITSITVHTTGSGFQEALTAPESANKIALFTFPHVGNTGFVNADSAPSPTWAAGVVAREPARRPSNWRTDRPLEEVLVAAGVVGISGIDTRALTRKLREDGPQIAGIFSGDALGPKADLVATVRSAADTAQTDSDLTANSQKETL